MSLLFSKVMPRFNDLIVLIIIICLIVDKLLKYKSIIYLPIAMNNL